MGAQAVGRADGELGVGHADVHVQREGRLAAGQHAQALVQQLVAGAARHLDLVALRQRVGPGHRRPQPERLAARSASATRSAYSSAAAARTVGCTPVASSSVQAWVSALTLPASRCDSSGSRLSMRWASAQRAGSSSITSSSMPTVQGGRGSGRSSRSPSPAATASCAGKIRRVRSGVSLDGVGNSARPAVATVYRL